MPVLKLTNARGKGPRGVNVLSGGVRLIAPGETRQVEVSEAEAKDLGSHFDVEGVADAASVETSDIQTAIDMLDPTNDEHWTNAGLPAVDAVSGLVGRTVTRAEINEAAPDFMRPTE